MTYVRVNGIQCEGCTKTHDLAIPSPAYPSQSYEFVCPESEKSMILSGFSPGARTVQYSVPPGCIEATPCSN